MKKQSIFIKIVGRILIILSGLLLLVQLADSIFYDIKLTNSNIIAARIDSIKKDKSSFINGRSVSYLYKCEIEYSFNVSGKEYGYTMLFGNYRRNKKITEKDYDKFRSEKFINVLYNPINPSINALCTDDDRRWKNGIYILNSVLLVLCVVVIVFDRIKYVREKLNVRLKKKVLNKSSLIYIMMFFIAFYIVNLSLIHYF